jgi:hypothetical protein
LLNAYPSLKVINVSKILKNRTGIQSGSWVTLFPVQSVDRDWRSENNLKTNVGYQDGCCAWQNGSERKSIPTAGGIREYPRPKAPKTQGRRPALLNDHSPGGYAQGKGRTHKKKRAPKGTDSNYQLKGRKTLLCKASMVEIESTRQQGNPKIKTKEQKAQWK